MEKIECKACSATVDKSIEFCSSCGEWLGLSIKDVENSDAKTEPEVTRRVRPPEELLSQPLSNYGATSLPTRNEVPGIRAVFFLAIIIPLIAAASYYYNQNIAEEVIEEIQVVEQSTTTSTSTTVQSLLQLQYPFSCSSSSSLGEGWSCEKIYDDEPSSKSTLSPPSVPELSVPSNKSLSPAPSVAECLSNKISPSAVPSISVPQFVPPVL